MCMVSLLGIITVDKQFYKEAFNLSLMKFLYPHFPPNASLSKFFNCHQGKDCTVLIMAEYFVQNIMSTFSCQ